MRYLYIFYLVFLNSTSVFAGNSEFERYFMAPIFCLLIIVIGVTVHGYAKTLLGRYERTPRKWSYLYRFSLIIFILIGIHSAYLLNSENTTDQKNTILTIYLIYILLVVPMVFQLVFDKK